jgi:hypothetical protein
MGYESKLVVVKKWSYESSDSFGETIAELNLSCMPNSFFPINETFENELEEGKKIFVYDSEDADRYGYRLRYTTPEKLLKVLHKCEGEEHYRRTEMAINFLRSFVRNPDWEDIVVFHYGY